MRGGQEYLAVDTEDEGRAEYLIKFVFMINGSHFTQFLMKEI